MPRRQNPNPFRNQWFRCVAAAFLIGSVLHHAAATLAKVQDANPRLISNQATYTYTDSASKHTFTGTSPQLTVLAAPLIDPFGQILGCNGEPLSDYSGFSVGLYESDPSDPTGTELGKLVPLTPTELPNRSDNNVPAGVEPNEQNLNPFSLTNADRGTYSFLLDPNQGQIDVGRTYLLVIDPPSTSLFQQRRIKIQILTSTDQNNRKIVRYVATSLDGEPISNTGETVVEESAVFVADAEKVGLELLAIPFSPLLCQPEQIQIVKTGDRAVAQPGDTVIYRLSLRSKSDANLKGLVVTDTLPLGFKFADNSARGELKGQSVAITAEGSGRTVTFRTDAVIPPGEVLNIAYAAQLTPDSLRGSGRNSAIVNAQRADNGFRAKDGPATYQLRIEPGIVSDCGTLIGRVFVDKNFDGEQQPSEPGVANATIFLEDGNRITTDSNGLFSVANVLPGHHTGVLDLSSLPGYTLAPNHYFSERNSQSRLVRLEPGGMARMNFAVTPTSPEQPK